MKISISTLFDVNVRYNEPHRKYHTWKHIVRMFEHSRAFVLNDVQQFAILMHDAVYVPGSVGKNEFRSTLYARETIVAQGLNVNMDLVALCILSTIDEVPLCESAALVVDLDLLILAAKREEYFEYVRGIREEHKHVSDAKWVEGRSAFLKEMLARGNIFHVHQFGNAEQLARTNMTYELNSLQGKSERIA